MTIEERLGHSSITVTLDRYGHLFPAQDRELAEALDATLRRELLASDWPEESTVRRLRRSER